MNDLVSLSMRLAAALLGKHGNEWLQAMQAELDHVPADERLMWSLGCLLAALKRRFQVMRIGNFQIPRGLLLLELLVCFAPITLGWWDAVFGPSGVLGLNQSVIQQHFSATPLARTVLGMMIGAAVIGLVGPIGLFLASRAAVTGAGLRSRALGIAMIAGVMLYIGASILLRMFSGPGAYAATLSFIVLIGALPALGTAHLMYLSRPEPQPA